MYILDVNHKREKRQQLREWTDAWKKILIERGGGGEGGGGIVGLRLPRGNSMPREPHDMERGKRRRGGRGGGGEEGEGSEEERRGEVAAEPRNRPLTPLHLGTRCHCAGNSLSLMNHREPDQDTKCSGPFYWGRPTYG